MIIPTMSDLYNRNTGVKSYRVGNGEIFVNFNRQMKPFIRVNVYPDKSKTFPFTKKGHEMAMKYLQQ